MVRIPHYAQRGALKKTEAFTAVDSEWPVGVQGVDQR